MVVAERALSSRPVEAAASLIDHHLTIFAVSKSIAFWDSGSLRVTVKHEGASVMAPGIHGGLRAQARA
jgi:hypothetical protein